MRTCSLAIMLYMGWLGNKCSKLTRSQSPVQSVFEFSFLKKCLNVRQKLGTRSHSQSLSLSLSLTLSLFLTLSRSHTHSISHSITLDMLNNFCLHLYAQNSPSHFLTLTLSRYLTFTLTVFQSLIQSLSTC